MYPYVFVNAIHNLLLLLLRNTTLGREPVWVGGWVGGGVGGMQTSNRGPTKCTVNQKGDHLIGSLLMS